MRIKTRLSKRNFFDFHMLLLIIIVAIIPLIVRLKIINVNEDALLSWNGTFNTDLFSYYKSLWIIMCGGVIFIFLITKFMKSREEFKLLIYLSPLVYSVLVIITTLNSKYLITSLAGFPNRYEGVLVLLAYMLIFVFTVQVIKSDRHVEIIINALLVSATVITLIGFTQLLSHDLILSEIGSNLFVPKSIQSNVTLGLMNNDSDIIGIYSTMFNSNTYGLYLALILPIVFVKFMDAKKNSIQIATFILLMFVIVNLIGTYSRGSYIGVGVAFCLLYVTVFKLKLYSYKKMIMILIPFLIVILAMNLTNNNEFTGHVGSLFSKADNHLEDSKVDKIKNFSINENILTLFSTNTMLDIRYEQNSFGFYDDNGRPLLIHKLQDEKYVFNDNRYKHYEINIDGKYLKIRKGKSALYFFMGEHSFELLDAYGKPISQVAIDHFGFEGYERIGSGRGYIWSRSLPILKSTLWLGTGPDTFAMVFPQNDHLGKLNYLYDAYIIIDKPHNTYLQIAINTGILSLLSILSMFFFYMFKTGKSLFKRFGYSNNRGLQLSLFCGIVAYFIASLFTDSTVSVAPVFWVLLGCGIKLNMLND